MAKKKDIPYEFTNQEMRELNEAFETIRSICNKYRGPDNQVDTPFKYFKNHIFYGLKQYTEEVQDYIFYVHGMNDRYLSSPQDLKRSLNSMTNYISDAIKFFRYSEDSLFKFHFKIDEFSDEK